MKRGQAPTAAGTAILLAIIASLIIMFVILIPPQDRAKLLEDDDNGVSSSTTEIDTSISTKNLLTTSPGRIDYLAQKEIEHPLPVINIRTKTEDKILAEKNIAYAKRGVFSEEVSTFTFDIPDLEHTERVLLALKVVQNSGGKLIVTLNEEKIFNAEVSVGSTETIAIPQNMLRAENVLIFAVSSPGLAFWATNDLSLEKIRVIAEVTSIEAQSSKNIFQVSETEKKNIEKIVLKFQPECKVDEVGPLSVIINGRTVYSAIPECNQELVKVEFSPESVAQGENEIIFFTEKGMYLLSHVVIRSELKEVIFPTYYFELSYEEYNQIIDENLRLRLKLAFVDVVARKFGSISLNGHMNSFDTKELTYAVDLSEEVVPGANAVMIKPKQTLDIRELKVDLIK